MKTMKIFAMGFMLLWAASVNFVAAQEDASGNDSIYGVENVSISSEGILSFKFYSTYEMKDLQSIHLDFYDVISNNLLLNTGLECIEYNDQIYFNYVGANWGSYHTDITSGVSEIEIEFPINWEYFELMGLTEKSLKIELYIEGEGLMPLSDTFRAGAIGKSNVLTFFFNPTATSLMELETDRNYTYKYFLLSGIATADLPIGVPCVKKTYSGNQLIATDKIMVNK